MALKITITDAGRAEITNAENTGTAPVTITHIALGAAGYTPDPSQAALQSEVKRVSSIAGEVVADDTISVTAKDEGSDTYTVREFGLITEHGTLFAVYAQTDPIIEKASPSTLLLTIDVILADLDASSLTFGDISFSNPPASESVAGVVRFADQAEVNAGNVTNKAITPKTLAGRTATDSRSGVIQIASQDEANAGSNLTRALTPGRAQVANDARYLRRQQNLADLVNKSQARDNLGLSETATTGMMTTPTDNTIGLLVRIVSDEGFFGLGSTRSPAVDDCNSIPANGFYRLHGSTANAWAGQSSGDGLIQWSWDSTVRHQIGVARTNNGQLWYRSSYNGTFSPWQQAASSSTTITAGDGLTGGGDLTADRTIRMGRPSSLNGGTKNDASGWTHTHFIDTTSSRTSSSTTTLLAAAAMNNHRTSGDHDDRYTQPGQYGWGTAFSSYTDPMTGGWGKTSFNALEVPSGIYYAHDVVGGRPNGHMTEADSGTLLHRQIGHTGMQLFLSRYPQFSNRLFFRSRTGGEYHEWARALAVTGTGRPFTVGNINYIDETGLYRIEGSTLNVPSGIGSGSILLHVCWADEGASSAATQLLLGYTTGRLLQRARNSSGNWTSWSEYVPDSRAIKTGDHLTGGGNLGSDRTLSLEFRADKPIYDNNGNRRAYFGSGNNDLSQVEFQAVRTKGAIFRLKDGNGVTRFSVDMATGRINVGDIPWSLVSDVDITRFFTGGNQSLANNGYQILPGGLILQWGVIDKGSIQDVDVTFPIRFPRNVRSVLITHRGTQANYYSAFGHSASGFTSRLHASGGHVADWIAIGN
ncbi:hypothetical protein HCU01_33490 [Halomonas cupida]|uniref:Phage tail-collar fibre protein n=1 Tax=Halomonas cupida TaxID=44933 RepID=A0A1M7KGV5_9GAMM|nr:phage tail protein [Halomonas cupida]GEN25400.1 hypothetical protein HCU01_33490 [Halomonas cupida]SHM64523.1 Phage tail-collar fibre protein [Halomonas cupida]